jgi:hypothetical protein
MLDLINGIPQKNVSDTAEQTIQNKARVDTQAFINNSETTSFNNISLNNRGISKTTDNPFISNKNKEEHLIKHFLNGGSLKALSFDELVKLSEIYFFSKDDIAAITDTNFIVYLYNNQHIKFEDISEQLRKDIAILEYNSGNYNFIKYIPCEYQTQDMFNAFLNRLYSHKIYSFNSYGHLFKYFSKDFQTKEVWDKILQSGFNISDIQFIPKEFQTIEICKKFVADITCFEFFNEDMKTLEMYTLHIEKTKSFNLNLIPKKFINLLQQKIIARITTTKYHGCIEGLELLPIELLEKHQNIILHNCMNNSLSLNQLPEAVITEELLATIANKDISYIPDNYLNIEMIVSKIATFEYLNSKEVEIIKSYFNRHKEKIQQAALNRIKASYPNVFSIMQLYQFIPDHLTEKKCLNLIKKCNGDIYNYLPDKYKENITIISHMLNTYFYKMDGSNFKNLTAETCHKIFDLLPATPAWEINIRKHKEFIKHKYELLSAIPEKNRSLQVWLYICNHNRRNIYQIPEQLFTKDGLIFLVDKYVKASDFMDITFMEYLFENKFFDNIIKQKILQHSLQCSARSSAVFLQIIKSSKIPHDFKIELEKKMRAGEFGFKEPDIKELYAKTNPLQQIIDAPFVKQLLSKIYKIVFSFLNNRDLPLVTQLLNQYLEQPITEFPEDTTENIFNNPVLVGGRTMKVNISDSQAIFYKFRKPQEKLQDFAKEGRFLRFLEENAEGKKLRGLLESDIPKLEKMVRIPLTDLPDCVTECPDGIDITVDSTGIKYVDLFVYSGSKGYYHYAHTPDLEHPENPYEGPLTGILKSIHDVGILTALGIYPTSMLPGFHFTDSDDEKKRPWTALHMLIRPISADDKGVGEFGFPRRNELYMTGKLADWFIATAMPDIAVTGLRDFGDIEFWGQILEPLKRLGSKNAQLFFAIKQMIAASNTVSECLIAHILVYARSHYNDLDYHYKNEQCITETTEVIKQIFSEFLTGRLKAANKPNTSLQQFLQLSDTDYNNTLTRIAQELVYWTANPDNSDGNYINHIKQRKLPEDLFDDFEMLHNPNFKITYNPEDLGRINGTFPLLAYTNLTALLNTRLLENQV